MNKLLFIFSCLFIFSLIAGPVLAQPDVGLGYATDLGLTATNDDPRSAAVTVVKYLLTFIALIATLVIIYGVVGAVTAGNEDRAAFAKKTIIAGVIGLIVILSAYAIVNFVVNTSSNLLDNF